MLLGGYAIKRAMDHEGTGGTAAAALGAFALAIPTGLGVYKQVKMGDDTITTNEHGYTKFNLMGPPKPR